MRIFIKCPYCSYTLYTKHFPLIETLTKQDVKCYACGSVLDYAEVIICKKVRHDERCDTCEARFNCFTATPAEEEFAIERLDKI